MNVKSFTVSILIGLFLVGLLPAAGAQYIDTTGGNQIYVNQPSGAAPPSNFLPSAGGMLPVAPVSSGAYPGAYGAANAVPYANGAVPYGNFAQQPYPYAAPYAGAVDPLAGMAPVGPVAGPVAAPYGAAPLAVPFADVPVVGPVAAPVAPCGPFTSGFSYGAQQASAFGPFTPPVTEAAEQFYQYPGLTPYGAYPGAGYAATGGVGYDPVSGYYGPFGGVVPL